METGRRSPVGPLTFDGSSAVHRTAAAAVRVAAAVVLVVDLARVAVNGLGRSVHVGPLHFSGVILRVHVEFGRFQVGLGGGRVSVANGVVGIGAFVVVASLVAVAFRRFVQVGQEGRALLRTAVVAAAARVETFAGRFQVFRCSCRHRVYRSCAVAVEVLMASGHVASGSAVFLRFDRVAIE